MCRGTGWGGRLGRKERCDGVGGGQSFGMAG